MTGTRPHASSSNIIPIQAALCYLTCSVAVFSQTALLLAMPRTKSKRRQRDQQDPVRRSTQSSTRVSSRAAASNFTPHPEAPSQPLLKPRTGESLTDLLSLIREQVRAELQSQQAKAGQGATVSQQATGSTTVVQASPTISGMPVNSIYRYAQANKLFIAEYVLCPGICMHP